MAREASVIVGSGIGPLKKDLPINSTSKERHLRGTSIVVLNPEDASAGSSGLVTAITLTGTAVQLPSVPLTYRRAISICNNSSTDIIYISFDSGLTTGNGWPIRSNTAISLEINGDIHVWGVSDAASTDVRVLELS